MYEDNQCWQQTDPSDILTCTGVINKINDGSVPFTCANKMVIIISNTCDSFNNLIYTMHFFFLTGSASGISTFSPTTCSSSVDTHGYCLIQ